MKHVKWLDEISADDVHIVGGKNASLGEMIRELKDEGVNVPYGFALTAQSYWYLIDSNNLRDKIYEVLKDLDTHDINDLRERTKKARDLIFNAEMPDDLYQEIKEAYEKLSAYYNEKESDVAVRSSATAEDLPDASFAGQQDTYLNVKGLDDVVHYVKSCYASIFTERATSYRHDKNFDHFKVGLSVCVQKMARSDLAASGVMFSIDTESGFDKVVVINASYGLGENIVAGKVNPDEFIVFKPTLAEGYSSIIKKQLGSKLTKAVYDENGGIKDVDTTEEERYRFSITDDDVLTLAKWALKIENHYSKRNGRYTPMDIEWAKDGKTGQLFVVQARPETVQSQKNLSVLETYKLKEKSNVIVEGIAVGSKIATGVINVIDTPEDMDKFKEGEILVTDMTDPDWEPIMKKAAAIITNRGGRTCHAAIISRELGVPAIVGCGDATEKLSSGQEVTVSCAEGEIGYVYEGKLDYEVEVLDLSKIEKPKTQIKMNLGNPAIAFQTAGIPNDGIGLARMEFIISSFIQVHPLALIHFDELEDKKAKEVIAELTRGYDNKPQYFVDKLAEGVAMLAASVYPNQILVRMSDFKTNEYANLIGGKEFEPDEENPMIGFRGASRYYSDAYREGFALECKAMKKVRDEFGLTNVALMIPFCRTPEEGEKVIAEMKKNGLVQGENGLEIYVMAEIPSNVICADEFAEIFDGFSIGSNDLTQLTLGIDRDSGLVAHLFDERHIAVKRMIQMLIEKAHKHGKPVGICGQGPSDFPDFAEFLVELGIDSMSLNPDSIMSTIVNIKKLEEKLGR
ncbi:phosphoenolpyruvate synthase [Hippea maritima]|uniref:Phosphoenolpyruvate synthase n=1 Tax=Hippea maritima (strain ATCC 700847 / DSM 10411 / MH2) TaxID=760142 RepID=F2LWS8_HIPMA|nr:phosphoenolpyruvate synthase [Hippea maritima]AEA33056.1 phosphoenolpyruvate synthase [Hippea maritima DSM 10411]